MMVHNNLIVVETLHPDNTIAKLAVLTKNISDEEQVSAVKTFNELVWFIKTSSRNNKKEQVKQREPTKRNSPIMNPDAFFRRVSSFSLLMILRTYYRPHHGKGETISNYLSIHVCDNAEKCPKAPEGPYVAWQRT